MPHFKCTACKTRLYSAAAPADLVSDHCPRCGSLLEPVRELAEIVGFQSIQPSAGRVDALFARRDELLAEAVALPTPEDNP